jgi:acyl-CoA thioester hydrolase
MGVEIRVAWGEMDAYGHVNNAVFLRWFETARIAWFDEVQFPEEKGKTGPVLRTANVEFLRAVKYPDTVLVDVRPTKVGRASVTLTYRIQSAAQQHAIVAKGETVVVFVDFGEGRSLEIPQGARARIEAEIARGGDE